MNETQGCLKSEQLRRLMECDLAVADVAEAEEHLSACEHCRAMLDRAIGNADWWQEARESLSPGESDRPVAGKTKSSHSDVLALLGPTDDPHMLGRIGTYEIIGILGRGGMGVVFKGFDGALNRYVAIKMLAPHLAASGGARKRFAREAQAAAAVIHDNVMAIHSVSEWQGVPYLVMPYGRGVSLQRRLSDQGPLELREILRIGMQTAQGLAAAHAQGLVHRDVKPANILLGQDVERVTLTDFGLARAVDDASLTRIGVLAGTPQYMSPEQARAKAVDSRSDLFSLGSVLYAMCTGRSPFRADSSYGVLRLITDEEPTPIREINSEIPEWLCTIVSRLMAKCPEDRFSCAGEVAELLEGCLAHVQQPTIAVLPSSLSKSSSVSFFWRYKQLFVGGIAMVSALVLGLAAVLAWQGTAPPDISGEWTGEDWGTVLLEAKQPGQYEGTFSGSDQDKPATDHRINPHVRVPDGGTVLIRAPKNAAGKGTSGTVRFKWSRVERRFSGVWEAGDERGGRMSLRLVDQEIRGAWTTGKDSPKAIETPRLADLLWKRSNNAAKNASIERYESLDGVWELVVPPGIEKEQPENERLRLAFTGGWFGTFRGLHRDSAARFKTEPQHSPQRISDLDFGFGWRMHGIYEINEDVLQLSVAPDSQTLPTKFRDEHRKFKRVKGKLADEQLDALKQYADAEMAKTATQPADLSGTRDHDTLNADIEFVVDRQLLHRSKEDLQWKEVPLAGVNKLLKDGQTIVIHVQEYAPDEWVQDIIRSASQRLDVIVKVMRKDSVVVVISCPTAATGNKKMPGVASAASPKPTGNSLRGKIRLIAQERGLAWINLGTAASVTRGMKFEVRAIETEGDMDRAAIVKGELEVIRVLDEHLSEVRILQDDSLHKIAADDDVIGIDKVQPSKNAKAESETVDPNMIWQVLGVRLEVMKLEDLPRTHSRYRGGMKVVAVRPGGPAKNQGIQVGDVLVGIHNWETLSEENLNFILNSDAVRQNNSVKFFVVRNGEILHGDVKPNVKHHLPAGSLPRAGSPDPEVGAPTVDDGQLPDFGARPSRVKH